MCGLRGRKQGVPESTLDTSHYFCYCGTSAATAEVTRNAPRSCLEVRRPTRRGMPRADSKAVAAKVNRWHGQCAEHLGWGNCSKGIVVFQ